MIRKRTREIRRRKESQKAWAKIDRVATGLSFLFVFYIGFSIISAALFKRDEVDWGLVLPSLIIFLIYIFISIVIMVKINKACKLKINEFRKRKNK